MKELQENGIHSEQLVDGKLLKVYRDRVELADGKESVREWIDHPGASAVVPVFDDGRTLLVRQFRYPPRRVFLEVPAGKLDIKGESPLEVAARELEEETGWKARRFVPLVSLYPGIGYSNEIIHFFVAEGMEQGTAEPGEGEHVEVVQIDFKEAVEMARNGEILDMKSVIALLFTERYLLDRDKEKPSKIERDPLE